MFIWETHLANKIENFELQREAALFIAYSLRWSIPGFTGADLQLTDSDANAFWQRDESARAERDGRLVSETQVLRPFVHSFHHC